LLDEATCCTSAGVEVGGEVVTLMFVLRLSLFPFAVTVAVTEQVPAVAAVQVVEADAGAENVPQPAGAALQLKERGSLSASAAVTASETWSPIRTAFAEAVNAVITGG